MSVHGLPSFPPHRDDGTAYPSSPITPPVANGHTYLRVQDCQNARTFQFSWKLQTTTVPRIPHISAHFRAFPRVPLILHVPTPHELKRPPHESRITLLRVGGEFRLETSIATRPNASSVASNATTTTTNKSALTSFVSTNENLNREKLVRTTTTTAEKTNKGGFLEYEGSQSNGNTAIRLRTTNSIRIDQNPAFEKFSAAAPLTPTSTRTTTTTTIESPLRENDKAKSHESNGVRFVTTNHVATAHNLRLSAGDGDFRAILPGRRGTTAARPATASLKLSVWVPRSGAQHRASKLPTKTHLHIVSSRLSFFPPSPHRGSRKKVTSVFKNGSHIRKVTVRRSDGNILTKDKTKVVHLELKGIESKTNHYVSAVPSSWPS